MKVALKLILKKKKKISCSINRMMLNAGKRAAILISSF